MGAPTAALPLGWAAAAASRRGAAGKGWEVCPRHISPPGRMVVSKMPSMAVPGGLI